MIYTYLLVFLLETNPVPVFAILDRFKTEDECLSRKRAFTAQDVDARGKAACIILASESV